MIKAVTEKQAKARKRFWRGPTTKCWWHPTNDLCGGRRLSGEEFEQRKRELEARERDRQEARKRDWLFALAD